MTGFKLWRTQAFLIPAALFVVGITQVSCGGVDCAANPNDPSCPTGDTNVSAKGSIELDQKNYNLVAGSPTVITATVKEANGLPLQKSPVNFKSVSGSALFLTESGVAVSYTTLTNTIGEATATVTSDATREDSIQISVPGRDDIAKKSVAITFAPISGKAGNFGDVDLIILSGPNSVGHGDSVIISAQATNSGGYIVPGVPIGFQINKKKPTEFLGYLKATTIATNSEGEAQVIFTPFDGYSGPVTIVAQVVTGSGALAHVVSARHVVTVLQSLSASYLVLAASSPSVQVDDGTGAGVDPISIRAHVLDTNSNPLPNASVDFVIINGPAGSARDEWGYIDDTGIQKVDETGTKPASVNYYPGTATGVITIQASTKGSDGAILTRTITVTVADLAAAGGDLAAILAVEKIQQQAQSVSILADRAVVYNSPSEVVPVSAWVNGSFGVGLNDVEVTFEILPGAVPAAQAGSISQKVKTANGRADGMYTAGTGIGVIAIRASVRSVTDGSIIQSASINLTLSGNPNVTSITMLSDIATVAQNSATSVHIEAIPIDANGGLVTGDFVSFQIMTAGTPAQVGYFIDGQGNSIEYYPGSQTGPIDIRAFAGTVSTTLSVFVVIPVNGVIPDLNQENKQQSVTRLLLNKSVPSTLSGPENTVTITGFAVNANNNTLDGVIVDFRIVSGPGVDPGQWGAINAQASTVNGSASVKYYAGFVTGLVVIEGSVKSVLTGAALAVSSVSLQIDQAPSNDETDNVVRIVMNTSKTRILPGLSNTVEVQAMALNVDGNPLRNIFVYYSIVSGPGADPSKWGAINTRIAPDTSGVAKTDYYSGENTGPITIQARVGTVVSSVVITIDNNPDTGGNGLSSQEQEAVQQSVANLVLTADPLALVVGPENQAEISVWAIASDNTPVNNAIVTFAVSAGPGLPAEWGVVEAKASTSNSSATVQYFAGTTVGTVTIRADIRSVVDNSLIVSRTIALTLLPQPDVAATVSYLVLNLSSTDVLPGFANQLVLEAQPINSVGNPVNGIPVYFEVINGPAGGPEKWGAIEPYGMVANGKTAVKYFAGSVTGTVRLQASAGAVTRTVDVTITDTPSSTGQATLQQETLQQAANLLVLTATPGTVATVGDTNSIEIRATVMNSVNNPVEGVQVDYDLFNGPGIRDNWGSISGVAKTGSNGVASAFYTPSTQAGVITVRARVRSVTDSTTLLTTNINVLINTPPTDDTPAVVDLILTSDANSVLPGLDNALTFTAVARNVSGNPLKNVEIYFSVIAGPSATPSEWGVIGGSAKPGTDGKATTTYLAGSVTGPVTIQAQVGAITVTKQINISTIIDTTGNLAQQEAIQQSVQIVVIDTVDPALIINSGQMSDVIVWAIGAGNVPVAGAKVSLSISAGPGAANQWGLIRGSGIAADGTLVGSYTAGLTTGTVTLLAQVRSVTDSAVLASATTTIELTNQAPSDQSAQVSSILITADPGQVQPGFVNTATIKAIALNASGNPLDNLTFFFSVASGDPNDGAVVGTAVPSGGVATAQYYAGTNTGPVTIVAQAGSVTAATTINVTYTAAAVDSATIEQENRQRLVTNLIMSASPASIVYGTGVESAIGVWTLNSSNATIDNAIVEFSLSGAAGLPDQWGTIAPQKSSTGGRAEVSYYAGTTATTITITARVRSVTDPTITYSTDFVTVQLTAPQPQESTADVVQLLFTSDVAELAPGFSNSSNLQVMALNASNNPVRNITVLFSVLSGIPEDGAVEGSAVPAQSGIATAKYFAGTNTGPVVIRATVGSVTADVTIQITTVPAAGGSEEVATQDLIQKSVQSLVVVADPSSMIYGSAEQANITAWALGTGNTNISGANVKFSLTGSSGIADLWGSIDPDGKTTNGAARVVYNAGLTSTTITITASVFAATDSTVLLKYGSTTITLSGAMIVDESAAATSILLNAAPAQIAPGFGNTAFVEAIVLNAQGNPLNNLTVNFQMVSGLPADGAIESAKKPSEGVARAKFYAGTNTGPITVRATVGTVTADTVIIVDSNGLNSGSQEQELAQQKVSSLVMSASPNTLNYGSGKFSTINVWALTAGNVQVDGAVVSLAVTSGPGGNTAKWGSIQSGGATQGGMLSANYTAGLTSGTVTIAAFVRSVTNNALIATTSTTVILSNPSVDANTQEPKQKAVQSLALVMNKTALLLGEDVQIPFAVWVMGSGNVGLPEVLVNVAIISGPGVANQRGLVDLGAGQTGLSGIMNGFYYTGSLTGTVVLEASVRSVTDGTKLVTDTVTLSIADAPSAYRNAEVAFISADVAPYLVRTGPSNQAQATAIAYDALGNVLDNVLVSFEIVGGSNDGSIETAVLTTVAEPIASATYYAGSVTGPKQIRITAGAASADVYVQVAADAADSNVGFQQQQVNQTRVASIFFDTQDILSLGQFVPFTLVIADANSNLVDTFIELALVSGPGAKNNWGSVDKGGSVVGGRITRNYYAGTTGTVEVEARVRSLIDNSILVSARKKFYIINGGSVTPESLVTKENYIKQVATIALSATPRKVNIGAGFNSYIEAIAFDTQGINVPASIEIVPISGPGAFSNWGYVANGGLFYNTDVPGTVVLEARARSITDGTIYVSNQISIDVLELGALLLSAQNLQITPAASTLLNVAQINTQGDLVNFNQSTDSLARLTFSTGTTNGTTGYVSIANQKATYFAGSVTGPITISATNGTVTGSTTVYVSNSPLVLEDPLAQNRVNSLDAQTPNYQLVQSSGDYPIVARDSAGFGVPDALIEYRVISGPGTNPAYWGTVVARTLTNANGQALMTYSSDISGTVVVEALVRSGVDSSILKSKQIVINVVSNLVSGSDADQKAVSSIRMILESETVEVNDTNALSISAYALDSSNVVVNNASVQMRISSGPGISSGWGHLVSGGQAGAAAQYSYFAGSATGAVVIEAYVKSITDGTLLRSVTSTVTVVHATDEARVASIILSANPVRILPGLSSEVALSALALDVNGAVLSNLFMEFAVVGGNPSDGAVLTHVKPSLTGAFSSTYFAGTNTGVVTIRAYVGSVSSQVLITVDSNANTVPMGDPAQEALQLKVANLLLDMNPAALVYGSHEEADLTVFAVDSNNAGISGAIIELSVTSATGVPAEWGVIEPQKTTGNLGQAKATYVAGVTTAAIIVTARVRSVTDNTILVSAMTTVNLVVQSGTDDAALVSNILLTTDKVEIQPGLGNSLQVQAMPISVQGNPVDNVTVLFTVVGGNPLNGAVSGSAKPANGIATATYYAGTNTGTVKLRAAVGSVTSEVSVFVTTTPNQGGTNLDIQQQDVIQHSINDLVLGGPSQMVAGSGDSEEFTVWALGNGNVAVDDAIIRFSVSGSSGVSAQWGIIVGETRTVNGAGTVAYTAGSTQTTITITASAYAATDPSLLLVTGTKMINLIGAPAADDSASVVNLLISAIPRELSPGIENTSTLTVFALNAQGNPLENVTVSFAVVGGDPADGVVETAAKPTNGAARVTYFAGSNTGSVKVRASVGSVTKDVDLLITTNPNPSDYSQQEALQNAVANLLITAEKQTLVIGGTQEMGIQVWALSSGNTPIDGVIIELLLDNGPGTRDQWGIISSGGTAGGGMLDGVYTSGLTIGTVTIRANVRSVTSPTVVLATTSKTVDLIMDSTAQDGQEAVQQSVQNIVLTAAKNSLIYGSGTESALSVWTLGAGNQTVDGAQVRLTLLSGPGAAAEWGVISGSGLTQNGKLSGAYTAGLTSGTVVIQAAVLSVTDGSTVTSTTFNLALVGELPGDDAALVSNIIASVSPAQILPGLNNQATISAIALDANGAYLNNVTFHFAIASGDPLDGAVEPVATPSSGVASAKYFAGVNTGSVNITVSVGTITKTVSVLVDNAATSADPDLVAQEARQRSVSTVVVVASPGQLIEGSGAQATISAWALNSGNGGLEKVEVEYSLSGAAGTASQWGAIQPSGTTNNLGVSQVSYSAGSTQTTITITAVVRSVTDSSILVSGATTVSLVAASAVDDAALVSSILLSSSSNEVLQGQTNTLTVRAIPMTADNTPVENVTVNFRITSGDPLDGAVGGSARPQNGVATTTYYAGNQTGAVTIEASVGAVVQTVVVTVVSQLTSGPDVDLQTQEGIQQSIAELVAFASPSALIYGSLAQSDISVWTLGTGNTTVDGAILKYAVTGTTGSAAEWGAIAPQATTVNGAVTVAYTAGSTMTTAWITINAYSVTSPTTVLASTQVAVQLTTASAVDDAATVTNLLLTANPRELQPGFANTSELSAIALNAQGNPVNNVTLSFEILSGGGAVETSARPSSGIAKVLYFASDATGTVVVRAHAGSATADVTITITTTPSTGDAALLEAIQQSVSNLVVQADPSSLLYGSNDKSAVQVWALGAGNIAINDAIVELQLSAGPGASSDWGLITSGGKTSNGIYTGSYTAGLTTGTVTITANIRSITSPAIILATAVSTVILTDQQVVSDAQEPIQQSVQNLVLIADINSLVYGSGDQSKLTVWALGTGNQPVAGALIELTLQSGPGSASQWGLVSGTGITPSGILDGAYTAGLSAGSVVIKAAVRSVTSGAELASTTTTISLTTQPIGDDSPLVVNLVATAEPTQMRPGMENQASIKAIALDANGGYLNNLVMNFTILGGDPNNGAIQSSATPANGIATATYYAGSNTGTIIVQVAVGAITAVTSLNITNDPAIIDTSVIEQEARQQAVANLLVTASPASLVYGSGTASTITAWALSGSNGGVQDVLLEYAVSGSSGLPVQWGVIEPAKTTDVLGAASAQYTAGFTATTITVEVRARSVVTGAVLVTGSTTVDLQAAPPVDHSADVTKILLSTNPFELQPGFSSTAQISAMALNALGNPVNDITITFTIPSGNPADGAVDPAVQPQNGVAVATYYAGSATGNVYIRASVGSVTATIGLVVTTTPGSSGGTQDAALQDITQRSVENLVVVASPSQLVYGSSQFAEIKTWALGVGNVHIHDAFLKYAVTAATGSIQDWGSIDASSRTVNGLATVNYSAGYTAATVWITVSAYSTTNPTEVIVSTMKAVQLIAQPAGDDASLASSILLRATPNELLPGFEHSADIQAIVMSAQNNPLANVVVSFEVLGGVSGNGAVETSAVPSGGIATAKYFAGSNTGPITIRATVGSVTQDVVVTVTNTPTSSNTAQQELVQQSVQNLVLLVNPASLVFGSSDEADLKVWALGVGNTAVANSIIDIRLTAGPGSPAQWGIVSAGGIASSGVFSGLYTAGLTTGTVTITAYVHSVTNPSVVIATATADVDLVLPSAAPETQEPIQQSVLNLVMTASPSSLVYGSGAQSELTVWAIGAGNRAVQNAIVTLSLVSGPGASSQWGLVAGSGQTPDGILTGSYSAGMTSGTVTVKAAILSVTDASEITSTTVNVTLNGQPDGTDAALVSAVNVYASPSQLAPGFINTSEIQAMALAADGSVLQNLVFRFAVQGGDPADGAVVASAEPSAGIAKVTYYAGTNLGVKTITAWAGSVSGSVTVTIANTPSVLDATTQAQELRQKAVANLVMTATPTSLQYGSGSQSEVATWALNSGNGALEGVTIEYSLTGASGTSDQWGAIIPLADTSQDGVARVAYTAGSTATTITITATVRSVTDASVLVTDATTIALVGAGATDDAAQVASLLLSSDENELLPGFANSTSIKAMALDALGNPVNNITILFSVLSGLSQDGAVNGSANPVNGIATSTYFAGTATGPVTIRASVGAVTADVVVTVVAQLSTGTNLDQLAQEAVQQSIQNLVVSASPSSLVYTTNSASTISVFALGSGNATVSNAILSFAVTSATGSTVEWGAIAGQASTINGAAQVQYIAGTTAATIWVTVRAYSVTNPADIVASSQTSIDLIAQPAGDDAALVSSILLASNPTEVQPGFGNTAEIQAIALSATGNPLENVTVSFAVVGGPSSGAVSAFATPSNGVAKATYYAGTLTGIVKVRASVGSVTADTSIVVTTNPTGASADQEAIQKSVANLVLVANPAALVYNSSTQAAVSVFTLDGNNATIDGVFVDLTLASAESDKDKWGSITAKVESANGLATGTYSAGSTVTTIKVIATVRSVTDGTTVVTDFTTIDLLSAPANDNTDKVTNIILSLSALEVKPTFANSVVVSALALNSKNNPVDNVVTYFEVMTGPAGYQLWEMGAIDGSAVQDGNGVAMANFYAGVATGQIHIRATIGTITAETVVTVTQNPSATSNEQELIQQSVSGIAMFATPDLIDIRSDSTADLRAWAFGTFGQNIDGVLVTFSVVGGAGPVGHRGTVDSGIVSANGLAQSTYYAGDYAGPVTLKAAVLSVQTGTEITSTTVTVTLRQVTANQNSDAAYVTLSVGQSSLPLGLANTTQISVQVMDINHVVLNDVEITMDIVSGPGAAAEWGAIESPLIPQGGVAIGSYYAGTTEGAVTVRATVGAISGTTQINLVSGSGIDAATLAQEARQQLPTQIVLIPESTQVATGTANSIVVKALVMNASNNPVNNVIVDFSLLSGPGLQSKWGVIQSEIPTSNGQADSTYIAGTTSGTVWIQAAVRSVTNTSVYYLTTTTSIELVTSGSYTQAELAVANMLISTDLQKVQAGLTHTVKVNAIPLDSNNAVVDVPVYFSVISGPGAAGGWGVIEGSKILSNNIATVNYYAGTTTGYVTLMAQAGAATATVVVEIIPASVNVSTNDQGQQVFTMASGTILLQVDRDQAIRGLSNTMTIEAFAFDSGNQPVPDNVEISFRVISGPGSSSQWGMVDSPKLTASGVVSTTYWSATTVGTVVIEAYSGAITAQVTLTVVDDAPSLVRLQASVLSANADGSTQIDLISNAYDPFGEQVRDGTRATYSLSTPNFGTLQQQVKKTVAGQTTNTYTVPDSGGTQIITVTIGGVSDLVTIILIDKQVATLSLSVTPLSYEIGDSGLVQATVKDVNGLPALEGTEITFTTSATYVTIGASSVLSSAAGTATTTVYAQAITSSVLLIAWANGISDYTQLSVLPPSSGSVFFVSALPDTIGVKGASSFGNGILQETSVVQFYVTSNSGQPVPDGTTVTFQLDGPTGAVLLQSSATTVNGYASTTVRSGTVSGSARVVASAIFSAIPFYAWSAPIAIQSGPPSGNHFTLGLPFTSQDFSLYMPGFAVVGEPGQVVVILADRFGNPVPENTQVYFSTEAGVVAASAKTDANGFAQVNYYTADPQPVYYGSVTRSVSTINTYAQDLSAVVNTTNSILAFTIGEEGFSDTNGNGLYDGGENVYELSEPFLDYNDNSTRDTATSYVDGRGRTIVIPDEPYWDFGTALSPSDGVWKSGVANGWDSNSFVWKSARQRWFGGPTTIDVVASKFIDVDGDGRYNGNNDIILFGPGTALSCNLSIAGATMVSDGTSVNSTTLQIIASDFFGGVPGGWGSVDTSLLATLTRGPTISGTFSVTTNGSAWSAASGQAYVATAGPAPTVDWTFDPPPYDFVYGTLDMTVSNSRLGDIFKSVPFCATKN